MLGGMSVTPMTRPLPATSACEGIDDGMRQRVGFAQVEALIDHVIAVAAQDELARVALLERDDKHAGARQELVLRSSDSIWSGAASTASAAISAWATRFFSQFRRKLAIEGRKIRISPSITKSSGEQQHLARQPLKQARPSGSAFWAVSVMRRHIITWRRGKDKAPAGSRVFPLRAKVYLCPRSRLRRCKK